MLSAETPGPQGHTNASCLLQNQAHGALPWQSGNKYLLLLSWQEENLQASTPAAVKKARTGTVGHVKRDPPAGPEASAQSTSDLLGDSEQQGSKDTDHAQQPEDTQQLPAGTLSNTYVDSRMNNKIYCSSW